MATKKEIELLSRFGMAYFNFDEPTGNYADQLGKGSVGVANNTIRKTSEGYGLTVGSNGANQNVNFGSSFSSKFNNPFTLKFRIKAKPSTNVNGSYFLGNYYASNVADRTFSIRASNTGELDFIDVISGVASNKITVQGVLDDKWHEIIYTRNSSSISVFVDYDLKGTVETKDLLTTNTSHSFYLLNIPAFITSERNLNGEIDELQIYNKDLYPDDFVLNKILLKSKDKVYSPKSEEILYETKMTSDTTPAPLVASASSVYNSSYPAWKAFNGTNTANTDCWHSLSTVTSAWIQLDFGKPTFVNKIVLEHRAGSSAYMANSPSVFDIQGSNDGITFATIQSVEITEWLYSESKTIEFKNIKTYRIYRLNIKSNLGKTTSITIGKITFGYKKNEVYSIPIPSYKNFLNYGRSQLKSLDNIFNYKNYILQDTVSEDTDGLWKQEINRKPLSIKFE